MIFSGCQGRPQPGIMEMECPGCGEIVEMATTDPIAVCEECGETLINERMRCAFWCDKARECLGDEVYDAMLEAADRIDYDPKEFENITRW